MPDTPRPLRVLLLNQTFYPDVVATAQYLTSLGEALAARGHKVTVIAGSRAYDQPSQRFPVSEQHGGMLIHRVSGTGLGKGAKWRRAVDFATFLMAAAWHTITLPRIDVTVALTSPPLVAVLAALRCRLRGGAFVYWVMDLNPDEALAAGWLRPGPVAWLLEQLSRWTLRSAAAVVVLDRFMQQRVLAKGVDPGRVHVVPPWSLDRYARWDPQGRASFRSQHGLVGKYVVMYSGNHSPVHPLDTLLQTASLLRDDPRFCFLFVGGGSEHGRLQAQAVQQGLGNVRFLPYQPLQSLAGSLSAADLQAVVLGTAMVGVIHPSKLYNILAVGTPLLYIGPPESHVTDAAAHCRAAADFVRVDFGQSAALAGWLDMDWARWTEEGKPVHSSCGNKFAQDRVLPALLHILEGVSGSLTNHPGS